MNHPLRIAHRGMPRKARENTLPSFSLALDAGADGVELDVHATRDDVVVVNHDPTLPDGEAIVNLTYRAILDRMGGSEHIPTLSEVCALVDGRAELFVEIKGAGIEQLVAGALAGYDGPLAIHSFDHALIERLSRSAVLRLGVLVEDAETDVLALMTRTGAQDVWPHHPIVHDRMVRDVHQAGGRVIPWTVNEALDARRLVSLDVDGLCGDDVTLFAAL
jgi:glycerophosphoryl diester phosphodiesterase